MSELGEYKLALPLLRAGASNFTECIQSASHVNHVTAYLELCQAALSNKVTIIQVLTDPDEDAAVRCREFGQYHKARYILLPLFSNGKLPFTIPIRIALRTKSMQAAGQLLLHGHLTEKVGRVDWQGLELETIEREWLSTLRKHNVDPKELILSKNNLRHIPGSLSTFQHLNILRVSRNNIVFIPGELFSLPAIREIDLSKNMIEYLPEAIIGSISPTLINLNVSYNKLTTFPEYFIESKLEFLTLSHNSLHSVPSASTEIKSLRHLDISYNVNIHVMPYELGGLSNLNSLCVDGIQMITNIPANLQTPVLLFLRQTFESLVVFEHFDVMVVGSEESDNTCARFSAALSKYAMNNKFSVVSMKSVNQFLMLHSVFKLPSTVYVLLWDCAIGQSLDIFTPLVEYLTVVCPTSPVVIAAVYDTAVPNDVDSVIQRSTRSSTIQDFVKDSVVIKPVSLYNAGMFSLSELVGSFTVEAKSIVFKGKVPKNYMELVDIVVVNHLKRLSEHISTMLSKEEFIELVKSSIHGINEDKELPNIVEFLHKYGALLHFPTAEGLEVYFTNRQCLANYLYRLVTTTSSPLMTDKAILPEFAIKDLVDDQNVSSKVFAIFAQFLVNKGFVLPVTDKKILLPSALERRRPEIKTSLPNKERVRRWIKLPVIPPIFWARFVCHQLITLKRIYQDISKAEFESVSASGHFYESVLDWKYWDSGFVAWENAYQLLLHVEITSGYIQILVPRTSKGLRLLHLVTLQINSLLKGWYPGIWELVEHLIPCDLCTVGPDNNPHCFTLVRCIEFAAKGATMKCSSAEGIPITVQSIAPDLVPERLQDDWLISPQSLDFNLHDKSTVLSPRYSETVFQGYFKDLKVAIKPFPHPVHKRYAHSIETFESPLLALIREMSILEHLKYNKCDYLMDYYGVSVDPLCLVFPLASYCSLEDVIASNETVIVRHVKLKIIYQIALALEHLHKNHIIHRDVSLGNILVFSLFGTADVNVKLGGFSDALYSLFRGNQQGIAGTYPAPEMMGYGTLLPYDERIDIFAFSFVMYEIIVGKIFGAEYGKRFTRTVARNTRPHVQHVCTEASCLTALINRGWDTHPLRRPYASDIVRHLKQPHLNFIANWQPIDEISDFLCATRRFDKRKVTDVFICSKGQWDNNEATLLSCYSVPDLKLRKSITLDSPFVPAMCCVHNSVWVSFWHKAIVVFSYPELQKVTEIKLGGMAASLSCSGKYVYVGYESGCIECFTFYPSGKPLESIQKVQISKYQVTHLEVCIDCVICSTQNQVLLVNSYPMEILVQWEASSYHKAKVFHTVVATTSSGTYVWVSFRKTAELVILEPVMGQVLFAVDCGEALPLADNIKVLSLISFHDTVWASLNTGHIMVFKASSPKLLTWIKVHDNDARHLLALSPTGVTPALVSSYPNSVVSIPKMHNVVQSTFVLSCGIGLEFGLTSLPDLQKRSSGLYLVILEAMEAGLMIDIEERSEREQLPMMRAASVCKPRLPEYENAKLLLNRSATVHSGSRSNVMDRAATIHGMPSAVKRASILSHVSEEEKSLADSREDDTEDNGYNITFFDSTSSESSVDLNAEMSFKERPLLSYTDAGEQNNWTVFDYQDAYKELIGEKSLPSISDTSYQETSNSHTLISDRKQEIDDSSSDDEAAYVHMHTAFNKPRYLHS